jgi:hypothetical protein
MQRNDVRQAGFTIIEVVVAVFILVMAALATFGLLSAATKNTQRAKATQVALDRAQQELEALRSLTDEQLALTAAPGPSSDPKDPRYRVSAGSYAVVREPRGSYHALVVNGGALYGGGSVKGGVVSPGPTPFRSGDVSGEVYRFIVWRNDERCSEAKCPGTQDYKQIVVAVKLDKRGADASERGYVEVQGAFIDPTDSAAQDPSGNKAVTAQQFYLSDTPCSPSGVTVRQEITGDHLLHNTLGTCASGLQEEVTPGVVAPGAPDALVLGRPPDEAPEDTTLPPLYDYSNDSYLEPEPEVDHGVQILKGTADGCYFSPSGPNADAKVHRWVTDPMPSSLTEGFKMTESVTIEFYTRTLGKEENTTGRLCVFLFKRHDTASPPDTLLTNKLGGSTYWTYTPESNNSWPTTWTKVRLTMEFNGTPYTIPAGDRLGVALAIESKNTPAAALPIMYDHPDYASRIEVVTSTPLEGG